MDSLTITAGATVALAIIGGVSIVTNAALAMGTFLAVRANRETTAFEQRQMDLLEREIKLQEEQAAAAREAARPKLRAGLLSQGQLYINGSVHYVHGTDPAEDVEVWIRAAPAEDAAWGLHYASVGLMVPGDRRRDFMTTLATALEQDRLPFLDFLDGDLGGAFSCSLVTWRRPDGMLDYQAEQHFSEDKPPRAVELKRRR